MRLVFCGTPQFAVPTLRAVQAAGHDVALVITQPDRPSGRGLQLLPSPVKAAALDAGLAIAQPEKIRHNAGLQAQLTAIAPDAVVVVAYGRIIPRWMLDLPRRGNINLHGSLLPKYRGAAPVQWAIAKGERVTGVTTMRLDDGLDTGDMLLARELPLSGEMTAEDALPLLAELGAELMVETLEGLQHDRIVPRRQNDSEATLAPILKRDDGFVDFTRTAGEIYNRWRGFQPWPGAWTCLHGKRLTLSRLRPMAVAAVGAPGEVIIAREYLHIACGAATSIEVLELHLEGKKRMPAADFLRGGSLKQGEQLG